MLQTLQTLIPLTFIILGLSILLSHLDLNYE